MWLSNIVQDRNTSVKQKPDHYKSNKDATSLINQRCQLAVRRKTIK